MAAIIICRLLVLVALTGQGETPYELYSMGCQLELDGRLDEAISYYEQALHLAPHTSEIYISLANALYKAGRYDEGIARTEAGLSRVENKIDLLHIIALGYIGKGDYREAITVYNTLRPLEPGNTDIYLSLSLLYEGTRDTKRAYDVLLELPDTLKNTNVYTRLGALAGKRNDPGNAIAYYRQAFLLDSTNTTALIGIGTAFDILNVKDSAIYYYEEALRSDTVLLSVGRRLVDLYTETDQYSDLINIARDILSKDFQDGFVRRNLGFGLYKYGMLEEALTQFLLASRLDPEDAYSRFYVGRIYLEFGDYDAALREIEEAIAINPDFIELWVYLGFIGLDKQDYATASYAFREAGYRGGDMVQVHYLLGMVAEMQAQYVEAYFSYQKSLKLSPENLISLEAMANLCERLDRKKEATRFFEKIIKIDTTNATALNYVGYSLAEEKKDLEYALELIDRALSLEGKNGYYIDSRGWVLYQMGRYEDARNELERATGFVEDAVILEHLGDVYIKLSEFGEARDAYQRALKLEPDNKNLQEKIRKLE